MKKENIKVVYIHWSNCRYCIEFKPMWEILQKDFSLKKVSFVSWEKETDKKKIEKFLKKSNNELKSFPSLYIDNKFFNLERTLQNLKDKINEAITVNKKDKKEKKEEKGDEKIKPKKDKNKDKKIEEIKNEENYLEKNIIDEENQDYNKYVDDNKNNFLINEFIDEDDHFFGGSKCEIIKANDDKQDFITQFNLIKKLLQIENDKHQKYKIKYLKLKKQFNFL